ncbi:MAG: phoA [Elusimicrobia bacterium]|nr:MAG: phoA [Elusimicrobiota bacterium]KAF0153928.1 MAG: phoA [Elusimicrobiota bacterium]
MRLGALLLLVLSLPAGAAQIVRGPYLAAGAHDSMTVRFRADVSTVAWLRYGIEPDCERVTTLNYATQEHRFPLFGLLADTTYCYRIFLPEPTGQAVYKAAEGRFKTFPPAEKDSFTFLAFGESGSASARDTMPHGVPVQQAALAAQMDRLTPDFVIHTGGLVEGGLDADADAQYFGPYAGLLRRAPFFPVPGSSEYGPEAGTSEGKNFLRENYSPFQSVPLNGLPPHYYYFDIGKARFIALDSNAFGGAAAAPALTRGSKQYKWLEYVLTRTNKDWKFVILHHPLYSSGEYGIIEELNETLRPLLEKHQVDAVFQGHERAYERTSPLVEDAVTEGGLSYITLGGGGRPPAAPREETVEWSEKFIAGHHFAEGRVSGRLFTLLIYGKDGTVLDIFRLEKPAVP